MLFTPPSLSTVTSRRVPTCHGDEKKRPITYLNSANSVNTNSNMDEVLKIIAEGRALTRSLAVIEAGASIDEARRECSLFLARHAADSLENIVIDCALRRICGLRRATYSRPQHETHESHEDLLFREGVIRWIEWVSGEPLPLGPDRSLGTRSVSTFNRMALTQWLEGVDHLRRGNATEGRRYFRRATTLGGLYGTRSNPVIQWTYAASFFPVAYPQLGDSL